MGTVSTTIKVVDKASTKLNQIYKNIEKINNSLNRLSTSKGLNNAVQAIQNTNAALNKTVTSTNNLGTAMNKTSKSATTVATGVKSIGTAAKSSYEPVNLLTSKLRRLASIYLGVMGSKAILGTSDMLTSADVKFTALGVDPDTTMNKIFNASQAALTDYVDMISNVSKSVTLAGDAFGDTAEKQVDNAIKFQEIMAKSYAISGASYQEQQSSMYQLVQALNSGNLQGDELRSVREGAPLAAKAIEEYAQKVTGSTESLKEMGSQGLITSQMVVEAVLAMEDQTEAAFENVRKNLTFAQIWTTFKNNAVRAFQPFLKTLREIANSKGFQLFVSGATSALYALGNVLTYIGNLTKNVLDTLAEHADLVRGVVVGLSTALGILAAVQLANVALSAVKAAISFLVLHTQMALALGVIGLLAGYLAYAGLSCETLINVLTILSAVFAVASIVAFMFGVTIFGLSAPVLLFIAALAILAAMTIKYLSQIIGFAFGVKEAWTALWDLIENALSNAIYSMNAKLADFTANFYQAIVNMANFANKILGVFGFEIDTSDFENIVNSARDRAERSRSKVVDLSQFNIADAFSRGYNTGTALGDKWKTDLDNTLAGFGDKVSGLFNITTTDDYAKIWELPTSDIGDIADDTDKISKNMDLTEDDLKYLRQIAEQEAINKWTAATIKIDMKNENNVHNINDLDGIAIGLSTMLQAELEALANGWHDV